MQIQMVKAMRHNFGISMSRVGNISDIRLGRWKSHLIKEIASFIIQTPLIMPNKNIDSFPNRYSINMLYSIMIQIRLNIVCVALVKKGY